MHASGPSIAVEPPSSTARAMPHMEAAGVAHHIAPLTGVSHSGNSYRSKSGSLMGPASSAYGHGQEPHMNANLHSLGSGSLLGYPGTSGNPAFIGAASLDSSQDGQIPALRFAAPNAVQPQYQHQPGLPPQQQQQQPVHMDQLEHGAVPAGLQYAGAALGTPFALQQMGMAQQTEEDAVLQPGSHLHGHMHGAPFAAALQAQGLPGPQYLGGQVGVQQPGLGQAAMLFPMHKQLAPRGQEGLVPRGLSTLPQAAELEGGVHESEMANDESLHWRRSHA